MQRIDPLLSILLIPCFHRFAFSQNYGTPYQEVRSPKSFWPLWVFPLQVVGRSGRTFSGSLGGRKRFNFIIHSPHPFHESGWAGEDAARWKPRFPKIRRWPAVRLEAPRHSWV